MSLLRSFAVAAPILLGLAAPASATQVFLQTGGIYNPGVVTVNGGGVYSSLIRFTGNVGNGPSDPVTDYLAFCVDLNHHIGVGINGQAPVNLQYHTALVTTDRNGNPLSVSQQQQIGGLAALGRSIWFGSDANKWDELAAIQAAIWTVEYPGATFDYGGLSGLVSTYVGLAPTLHGVAYGIYADTADTQGFIIGGGVPEPGNWALLIAGFGLIGATARRRRLATVTA